MMMVGKYMTQPQPSTNQHNKYSADPSCLSSWRFKENTKHKYQTQIPNTKYQIPNIDKSPPSFAFALALALALAL